MKENDSYSEVGKSIRKEIDEWLRFKATLEVSGQKYKTFACQLPVGVYRTTEQGEIVFANPALASLLGFADVDALKGINARHFFKNKYERQKQLTQWKIKKDITTNEFQFKRNDGKLIWVRDTGKAVVDQDKICYFIGVLEDITEYKETLEKLKESEDFYKTLINILPYSLVITDIKGRVTCLSRMTLKMYGYNDTHELLQSRMNKLFSDDDWQSVQSDIKNAIKGIHTPVSEYLAIKKDGTPFHVACNIVLLGNIDGSPKRLLFIIRDISERKYYIEQINASLKEKEILLKEIHHRVKNNMALIASLLNMQSRFIEHQKDLEIFRECRNRIRMMGLIHEKLMTSGNLGRIDIYQYIEELTDILFKSYGADCNRIQKEIQCLNIELGVDKAIYCGLIINELVSNALKYAFPAEFKRKGRIEIILRQSNNRILLIVRDNGIGFSEGCDLDTYDSLGLHLVKILVEDQLGGSISLQGSHGAVFEIMFHK